jgi:hypothetical protein
MQHLNALMETEEMATFFENNQEVINETSQAAEMFSQTIFEYVVNNPDVFMDAEVENIEKNIRIFSEAAMCQFLTEAVAINSNDTVIMEPLTPENALNDYI